ncbi:hypothetical protein [Thermodesulfitimonas autotrophica]|uniref:hypothetical protein n=1 Tax=Thermodesulfitimonas autotrophica TaxID=1894989 RepID=UPI002FE1E365
MYTDADERRLREAAKRLFAPLLDGLRDAAKVSREDLKKHLESFRENLREHGREIDLRLGIREFRRIERELAEAGYPDRAALVGEFRERLERDLERLLERRLERTAPYSPDREYFARRRERRERSR